MFFVCGELLIFAGEKKLKTDCYGISSLRNLSNNNY